MKKLIYIASICSAMMFTSCEDFLTVSSPDKVTTGNFWKSQKEAEATMASVYAQLYHGDSYATSEVRWPVEAFRTDLYNMGTDAINYQTWTDIYKFTYTNGKHSSPTTIRISIAVSTLPTRYWSMFPKSPQKESAKQNATNCLPKPTSCAVTTT